LAIEATTIVGGDQPQLSLRFHEGQDRRVYAAALDSIAKGTTFPILYNDDVNVPAVAKAFGVTDEIAARYIPYGCGEYVLGSTGLNSPDGVINLMKALEIALHGGVDPVSGRRVMQLPPVDSLTSSDKVWRAYESVVEYYLQALAVQAETEYRVAGDEALFGFISVLTDGCVASGKGVLSGGAPRLGATVETYGNTNAADSLHVIDEVVFRRRTVTLTDLVAAIDMNFQGSRRNTDIRRVVRSVSAFGNDDPGADAAAMRVHSHVCSAAQTAAKNTSLDHFLVVIINNWANTILGRTTGAGPDGRFSGTPLANANNPSPGRDTNGVTAFLNSLVKLDPSIHAGSVQNMKLGSVWFDEKRPVFEALLDTYFATGGTQAMITVVSPDDLEAAMREPEKWGHLMVRVGGFSVRFVELPRDAQMEILARTLH
jgi:pyruvate-formate lyase